jgi:hypothetical protein
VPLLLFQESELANRQAEVDFDQLTAFDVLQPSSIAKSLATVL